MKRKNLLSNSNCCNKRLTTSAKHDVYETLLMFLSIIILYYTSAKLRDVNIHVYKKKKKIVCTDARYFKVLRNSSDKPINVIKSDKKCGYKIPNCEGWSRNIISDCEEWSRNIIPDCEGWSRDIISDCEEWSRNIISDCEGWSRDNHS